VVSSEVQMPSIIVLNLSNDGYFLPPVVMETEEHLLEFLNGVLDKSFEVRDNVGPLPCLMKWRWRRWCLRKCVSFKTLTIGY